VLVMRHYHLLKTTSAVGQQRLLNAN